METRKRLAVGILAHVDAGKTTLSEALLFRAGSIRSLGRVDRKDTFLDHEPMERERGITIFSKQARFSTDRLDVTLLDTPGHTDFSAEAERTLQVLDYAILVISGTDGVQNHTLTLWQLLRSYRVPTILFVNKMDTARRREGELALELQTRLDERCCPFYSDEDDGARGERFAMLSEELLEAYLAEGRIAEELLAPLVADRKLFPCFFGSALRMQGVDALLGALERLTLAPVYPAEMGAMVYKIMRDGQNTRLTCLKVTGGRLSVRDELVYVTPNGREMREKVSQIRLYSGTRMQQTDCVEAGEICTVAGLSESFAGMGLGRETDASKPLLEPVLSYRIRLPEEQDPLLCYPRLRQLEEEEPTLRLIYREELKEIHVSLMGEVQIDVIKRLILDRFGWEIEVDEGRILYRETVRTAAEGVGHYEPLRHYAEVHLLIEPLPAGSGLSFESKCPDHVLERKSQRLILSHLAEKQHRGVLTGAPLTDVRITLLAGKTHVKHTEGGDLREATWRAVRQGLMQAESVLLEPCYRYRLEVPSSCLGRAMTDLQQKHATAGISEQAEDRSILSGIGPVSELRDYAAEVRAYTRGEGSLTCRLEGYAPCHNAEEVISAAGYDPNADVKNPSYSVFCKQGAGFAVAWDSVKDYMHLSSGYEGETTAEELLPNVRTIARSYDVDNDELEAIMLREFGPMKRRKYTEPREVKVNGKRVKPPKPQKEILVVDGYNVIFSWESLKRIGSESLEHAREILLNTLGNYVGYTHSEITVVFDGYRVKDNRGEELVRDGVRVIFTKENETADARIERMLHELGPSYHVRAVTSDALIQISALHSGVLRMTSWEFEAEVQRVRGEINEQLLRLSLRNP